MWRIFRTAHDKVAEFRADRTRQPDDRFLVDCHLPNGPESARIALGVRRAVAGVGLVDPTFVRADDRFPEELGSLPLYDSMDWMALILELEVELGERVPQALLDWKLAYSFSVRQLVQFIYDQRALFSPIKDQPPSDQNRVNPAKEGSPG